MRKESTHINIKALLKLIDDPDESIYQKVRSEILLCNITVLPLLDKANQNSLNPLVNQRIAELTKTLYDKDLYSHFLDWNQNRNNPYEDGLFLTSRLYFQSLNKEEFLRPFTTLHTDIWREMNESLTALEKIKIINHILFKVSKFSIISSTKASIEQLFIPTILKTKKATDISITALYLWITEKLKLPVKAVLLPQKTILAFYSHHTPTKQRTVLFYISPSDSGSVFTKEEIEKYLKEMKIEKEKSHFKGVSTKSFFSHYLSIIEQQHNISIINDIKELIHNNNESHEKNN
jgi:regulator of sirC expression with transglutaminase-like and TPR domain